MFRRQDDTPIGVHSPHLHSDLVQLALVVLARDVYRVEGLLACNPIVRVEGLLTAPHEAAVTGSRVRVPTLIDTRGLGVQTWLVEGGDLLRVLLANLLQGLDLVLKEGFLYLELLLQLVHLT
mmetsp:Transcript_9531/g.9110  ORF Transcript_9531/g.9110 Transcript_9531/m.9110 type:complete len:122 (+) Transcript_9531:510-875(+)